MNDTGSHDAGSTTVLDAAAVRAFHGRLGAPVELRGEADDGERLLTELRALDELRNAISARQARLAVAAHQAQRDRDAVRGLDRKATHRLVGSQVGFARRCSGQQGAAFVNVAHALTEDMPHTLQALSAGVISQDDAARVVRETTGLTPQDRARVDAGLAGHLGTASAKALANAATQLAYQVDPDNARARRVNAEADRRVSVRPAPDCMAHLTALLPIKDALACQASLNAAADDARADDPQASRGQVMADTLVERVTGRQRAHDNFGVCVDLLLPVDTLTGQTPAQVPGYGPVPADLAREWILAGDPTGPQLRRLFTHPGTGDIIGMDSRARFYPGLLASLILFRDQTCRTPWCGAPIRHTDHITSHADGGDTSERNGQGLCARCNYIKEHPDFRVTGDASRTTIRVGGFTATSHPPNPPGLPPPTTSYPERTLMDLVWRHNLHQRDHEKKRRKVEDAEHPPILDQPPSDPGDF